MRTALLAALTIGARIAAANEIVIGPTDARGLQRAVDRLSPGDTLTLAAGDYHLEGVELLPHHAVSVTVRGVTIRGQPGARLVGPSRDGSTWTLGLLLHGTESVRIEGLEFSGFVTGVGVGSVAQGVLAARGLYEHALGLENNHASYSVPASVKPCDGCSVSDCKFEGSGDAIDVLGADGFTATGNHIADVAYGIVVDGFFAGLGLAPIALTDNVVEDAQWTGLHLQGLYQTPVIVSGNTVRRQVNEEIPKFAAIRVRDAQATATVDGNVLTDNTRGFLGHNNANLWFINNTVSRSRCSGIVMVLVDFFPSFVPGSTAHLVGNVIEDSFGAALLVSGYVLDPPGRTLFLEGNNISYDDVTAVDDFGAIADEDTCSEQ